MAKNKKNYQQIKCSCVAILCKSPCIWGNFPCGIWVVIIIKYTQAYLLFLFFLLFLFYFFDFHNRIDKFFLFYFIFEVTMKLFTNGQATLMNDVNFSKVRIHLSQKKGIEFVNEMKWNVENIHCNLFLMWRKEN